MNYVLSNLLLRSISSPFLILLIKWTYNFIVSSLYDYLIIFYMLNHQLSIKAKEEIKIIGKEWRDIYIHLFRAIKNKFISLFMGCGGSVAEKA